MPARAEEIENAEEEGLMCKFLSAPVEFFGDDKGWVRSMKCTCMELTEPDEKGRQGVQSIPCSDFEIPVDTVIIAIGQPPQAPVSFTLTTPSFVTSTSFISPPSA